MNTQIVEEALSEIVSWGRVNVYCIHMTLRTGLGPRSINFDVINEIKTIN